MIRVLVADDHLAVREGLHALLAKEKEIAIVGEAGDGSTALELARRLNPDLVVLDDSMTRRSCCVRSARAPPRSRRASSSRPCGPKAAVSSSFFWAVAS